MRQSMTPASSGVSAASFEQIDRARRWRTRCEAAKDGVGADLVKTQIHVPAARDQEHIDIRRERAERARRDGTEPKRPWRSRAISVRPNRTCDTRIHSERLVEAFV